MRNQRDKHKQRVTVNDGNCEVGKQRHELHHGQVMQALYSLTAAGMKDLSFLITSPS